MRFDYTIYYIVAILDVAKAVVSADSSSIIDLMQHVGRNASHAMMKSIPGSSGGATAYYLQGSSRHLEVNSKVVGKVKRLLDDDEKEFTLLATIRQQEKNTGSIISITSHNSRYLEVESSGRRDELRLHYSHNGHVRTETFLFRLADNRWHNVALGFSREHVELFIDCKKVFERRIAMLDPLDARLRQVAIWLGQRDAYHALFKGAIEYVKIAADSQGILHQCPHANIACPTCSQFRLLEHSIQMLNNEIRELGKKLSVAEARISELEECDCQRSCDVNGRRYRDGEIWDQDTCRPCRCKNGVAECTAKRCEVNCTNPVTIPGRCCPECSFPLQRFLLPEPKRDETCYTNGRLYEHGEQVTPVSDPCVRCYCDNGKVECLPDTACPELTCPETERYTVTGECCKICKGTDYCKGNTNCHNNSRCISLETKYICECLEGFEGDDRHCEDIDECQTAGGSRGHHCSDHTHCVNTPGSYQCQCDQGYTREDAYLCRDNDECLGGLHDCHPNATCTNTLGSYTCKCNEGFQGNGRKCKPVCREGCTKAGACVAPGVCQCREGFAGLSCAEDLDECALGIVKCSPTFKCVNQPGGYACRCKDGFIRTAQGDCQDFNECASSDPFHACPPGTKCVNREGSYECQPSGASGGTYSVPLIKACHRDGRSHPNGTSWALAGEQCTICTCHNGEVQCRIKSCDCSSADIDRACCPQCPTVGQCRFYGRAHRNGERWIDQCHNCQCLDGEVDCWPMDCPQLVCRGRKVPREGHCCPQCEEDRDPCHNHNYQLPSSAGQSCAFNGTRKMSGDKWRLQSSACLTCNECTMCECKGGHICCAHDEKCSVGGLLLQRGAYSSRRLRHQRKNRARGGGHHHHPRDGSGGGGRSSRRDHQRRG